MQTKTEVKEIRARPCRSIRKERRTSPSLRLFGAEYLVAGISETGQDIADLVEPFVNRRHIDIDIRMEVGDPFQSFRRGHQKDAFNRAASPLFQGFDGRQQGAAGGQHRVEDEGHPAPPDRRRS